MGFTNQWTGGVASYSAPFKVTIANAGGSKTALVACFAVYAADETQYITDVIDSAGNTWTYIGTGADVPDGGHTNTEMWLCLSPAVDTYVEFTCSTAGLGIAVNVSEYSFSGTPSIDEAGASYTNGTSPINAGNINTNTANELVVGCLGYGTGAGSDYVITPASCTPTGTFEGLTLEQIGSMNVSSAYGEVASAQAVQMAWTSATGDQQVGWVIVAIKIASAPPAGPNNPLVRVV